MLFRYMEDFSKHPRLNKYQSIFIRRRIADTRYALSRLLFLAGHRSEARRQLIQFAREYRSLKGLIRALMTILLGANGYQIYEWQLSMRGKIRCFDRESTTGERSSDDVE